jgi:hypothetical protein
MNMLSKPVERCRKTSYSLNLSLVLSALNALYKLLEKFCCILSLKKHLQAIHISVQSAHRTSLRRPAARTAARKSASSHALLVVRSSGGLSEEQVRELGGGGLYSAGRNVDRGMYDRQPAGLRQLHRRHDVLQHHVRSMDWTAAICEGCSSITRRAACWGVSRWLTRADRAHGCTHQP